MQHGDAVEQGRIPVGLGDQAGGAAVGEHRAFAALVHHRDHHRRGVRRVHGEVRGDARLDELGGVPLAAVVAEPGQQVDLGAQRGGPGGGVRARAAGTQHDVGRRVGARRDGCAVPGHDVGDHVADDEQGAVRHDLAQDRAIWAARAVFPRTAARLASNDAPPVPSTR